MPKYPSSARYAIAAPVAAIPCWVIQGVYTPEAGVDITENHILVSSEELARKVCEELNKDPQMYVAAFFGSAAKYIKCFETEEFLVHLKARGDIHTVFGETMDWIRKWAGDSEDI
jgi:hypothetical protein